MRKDFENRDLVRKFSMRKEKNKKNGKKKKEKRKRKKIFHEEDFERNILFKHPMLLM